MPKRKYTMSDAARKQRQAAGLSLAGTVGSAYYSVIGLRGYKAAEYNRLMWLAENFEPEPSMVRLASSPAHLERYRQAQRDHYRELAQRYKLDNQGNRIMLELFTADNPLKVEKRRRRQRKAAA